MIKVSQKSVKTFSYRKCCISLEFQIPAFQGFCKTGLEEVEPILDRAATLLLCQRQLGVVRDTRVGGGGGGGGGACKYDPGVNIE